MFGAFAFSETAFSVTSTTPIVDDFGDLIANPNLQRIYLIEVDAFDKSADSTDTQYYSDIGYATTSGESPASQYYDARSIQPLEYRVRMRGSSFAGLVGNTGITRLVNADGGLDSLLESHAVDAREIRVDMGRPTWDRDQFNQIFKGAMQRWESKRESLNIEIRDASEKLNLPIQDNFYAGTGGNEGGDDLKDQPKPLCYGKVLNVPAILVDSTNLVYQVHDTTINDVLAVYDRGVELTEVGSNPSAGEWAEDTANGTFTLGGSPDGQITADVEGDATGSGYVKTTADIIDRIVRTKGGLSDGDINTGSFSNLNDSNGSEVGIWIPGQRNTLDVLDEIIKTVGGFVGFKRNGRLSVGVVKEPSASPTSATYEEQDIIEIEQIPLPDEIRPPNWRRQVAWGKNYKVQTDIAGSVADAQRAFIQEPFRVAASTDSSIKTDHTLATDPPVIPSLFTTESDAQDEADRLLALFKQQRFLYRMVVKKNIYDLDINGVINVTFPRWNLTNGADMRIVGLEFDARRNQVTITGFT